MSDRVTLSPAVQPLYEHIASADFHALFFLEAHTLARTEGLDGHERSLLLKAIALRRRELREMADAVSKELSASINHRFQHAI